MTAKRSIGDVGLFAGRLDEAQTRADLTNDQVADRAGMHERRYRRLCDGDLVNGPTLSEVVMLARVLRVCKTWLAFGEGAP